MTIKKIMAAITATVLCFMLSAAALAEYLVPGGGAVGAREVRAQDVLLHTAASARPDTEPDARQIWPL